MSAIGPKISCWLLFLLASSSSIISLYKISLNDMSFLLLNEIAYWMIFDYDFVTLMILWIYKLGYM